MTAKEDRVTATVLRAIAKEGKTVSVVRPGAEREYNTQTLEVEGDDPAAPVDCKALIKDLDSGDVGQGSIVEAGDVQFMFAAKGFAKPTLETTISFDGNTYTVVSPKSGGLGVKTQYVQEVPAYYKVHGRLS